jgi:hypothetical protein
MTVSKPDLNLLHQIIEDFSSSVQPLVFETGIDTFPYSTSGTVFLVGYKGNPYVVTTRHGLHVENPPAICVFPTDTSQRIFPLGKVLFVPRADEAEDFMDLAVIDIDLSARDDPELCLAKLIDFAKVYESDWNVQIDRSELYVLGYPSELSEINCDTQELRTDRIALSGSYGETSSFPYVHICRIADSKKLDSFSGISGGPVFGFCVSPKLPLKPLLCGMALRGTPGSGLIYFLEASVLLDALEFKFQQDLACSSGGNE